MFNIQFNMKLKQNVKQAGNQFNIQFNMNVKQNVKHTRNGAGEASLTQFHTPPLRGWVCDETNVKLAPAWHRTGCETALATGWG